MITNNYTMTLYEIINNFFTREEVESWFKDYQLSDYLTDDQILSISEHGVWSKDKLAKKIVDHFLMEQIGFETMGLFKHQVKVKMQELMEEKLPLIYSSSIEYDPLVNVDYTETFERTIESDGTLAQRTDGGSQSASTNTGSGLNISSDTPMTNITKENILAGNYASGTNANEQTSTINDSTVTGSSTSGNSSNDTSEEYSKRVKGNSGVSATAQKMVEQYRQNIIAIDKEIIDELNSLFMCIY